MRRLHRAFALSCVLGVGVSSAHAQATREDLLTIETTKAPPAAALRSILTTAFLQASTKETKAIATTGIDLTSSPWNLALRLSAESPLGRSDGGTDLVDLKGLGDGTQVELALHGHWWKAPQARPSEVIDWCNRWKSSMSSVADCTHIRSNQVPDSLYGKFLRATGWSEPIVFDAGWKAGRAKASYLEEGTLKSGSIDKLAHSIGADVGVFFTDVGPFRTALLGGGYHYALDYRKSAATQICTPYGTTGALRCRNAIIGRPKKDESGLINVELRAYFNPRWAVNPEYVRKVDDKTWTLEMPIYFVPDAKGALIGGISPRYASDAKDWQVRVFVGKAFGL